MYPGGDPFQRQSPDPFGAPSGPVHSTQYGGGFGYPTPPGPQAPAPQRPPLNTFAVLSPVLAVVLPPAGVVLGHLALPQIKRTGERGRPAAIAGLIIGYLMCVALIAALIWWLTTDDESGSSAAATTPAMIRAGTTPPRPTTITQTADPTAPPRVKVDHATVPIGTCVEVQRRSTESDDALDLFEVDCQRRDGVYTVTQRVADSGQCGTVYAAASPNRAVAVCLDPYQ
ncbi:DUF4190 domain-containing protein [Mycolicibacterium confluentis]|uniref:Uncharacterized protein n=1 Tax=Mycolicibacterium confluentis TaxID=28047 RepID=A0A7I7Y4H3_9MYCO|nr:DUF4190 domain-containing protein [Mycolicibacterium confluentis]ORV31199.1 hypothetical protein AWB99_12340 [Mycolicibacterium confluentis]BBZ36013.1 hypothetical protein MCNF_46180 [Mycolicibacterium confluentis]